MAIYGRHTTSLQPYGTPGGLLGRSARYLMVPLNFTLQIAGPSSAQFPNPENYQSCQDANAGLQLIVTVTDENGDPVNIREATSLQIALLEPDGVTRQENAGILLTNGMDGRLYYLTTGSDINQDGLWRIQAEVTIAGNLKTTRWGQFRVGPNITEDLP